METNVKTNVKPQVKQVYSNATVFKRLGVIQHTNKKALCKDVLKFLNNNGQFKNNKNIKIDEAHLLQQLSAIIRCNKQGKFGWDKFDFISDDKQFVLKVKSA